MKRKWSGALASTALASLALGTAPVLAQERAENKLLGIALWQSWSSVLKVHGTPTRIEPGADMSTGFEGTGLAGGAGAAGAMSSGKAGAMGMAGPMGMGGGMSMPPGLMGAPGAGASAGPGAMSGMMSQMMMRAGGMASGSGGGMMLPGLGGMGPEGPGGAMGPGAMGGMMGGGAQGAVQSGEGEVTWVYERGPNTYKFLFNKDGRVIQIQSYGYKGGGATRRGVTLGDGPDKIYRAYGWPGNLEKTGGTLTLDYSNKSHCVFQLADPKGGKNVKVVGITIALTERANLGGTPVFGGGPGMGMGMMRGPMGGPAMGGLPAPGGEFGGALGAPRRGGGARFDDK